MATVAGRARAGAAWAFVMLISLGLASPGCAAPRMPAADLRGEDWQVQESEVAWRPGAGKPELVGELWVARGREGRSVVQFSKQGLPWLTARRGPEGWRIDSMQRRVAAGGRGRPPGSVPWFLIERLPPSPPPKGSAWKLEEDATSWRIVNPGTGESVEGPRP